MKFTSLTIQNFKAIKTLSITNLEDVVVIAGKNGVGKSTVFDAIRLFKSTYGSYGHAEYNSWMSENGIRINMTHGDYGNILSDKEKPLIISAEVTLSAEEKAFLISNKEKLINEYIWRNYRVSRQPVEPLQEIENLSVAEGLRYYDLEVQKKHKNIEKEFDEILRNNNLLGRVHLKQGEIAKVHLNIVLNILFSISDSQIIGIIDYHGADRAYNNEDVGQLQFNNKEESSDYALSALYNYQNKYFNIKSALAASYVKALIAEKSQNGSQRIVDLNDSLSTLFKTFFPGKSFRGVLPKSNGTLEFPIFLQNGSSHDLSSLSSGEKEILFGYLRLHNQARRNSILLIDEPELHLNPSLAIKLPEFYFKFIGKKLNNQIWLVTHSEGILKEARNLPNFSIFHLNSSIEPEENQCRRIAKGNEIEAAIIDLVGDYSSYHFGQKVVIFEGENSEFDKTMVNTLFRNFSEKVNSISAGSKKNNRNLHGLLDDAQKQGVISQTFFSIVDKDHDKNQLSVNEKQLKWDVYHIENYLLNSKYIFVALDYLNLITEKTDSTTKIDNLLKSIANDNINDLIKDKMNDLLYDTLLSAIKTKGYDRNPYEKNMHECAKAASENILNLSNGVLSENQLYIYKSKIKLQLDKSLKSEEWKKEFKGRSILIEFTNKHAKGVTYTPFAHLIIKKMGEDNFQPNGMKSIVDKILNHP